MKPLFGHLAFHSVMQFIEYFESVNTLTCMSGMLFMLADFSRACPSATMMAVSSARWLVGWGSEGSRRFHTATVWPFFWVWTQTAAPMKPLLFESILLSKRVLEVTPSRESFLGAQVQYKVHWNTYWDPLRRQPPRTYISIM